MAEAIFKPYLCPNYKSICSTSILNTVHCLRCCSFHIAYDWYWFSWVGMNTFVIVWPLGFLFTIPLWGQSLHKISLNFLTWKASIERVTISSKWSHAARMVGQGLLCLQNHFIGSSCLSLLLGNILLKHFIMCLALISYGNGTAPSGANTTENRATWGANSQIYNSIMRWSWAHFFTFL